MRMITLGAMAALGMGLCGAVGVSAAPVDATAIVAAARVNSPIIKTYTGGVHHHGRYPGCTHLKSYDPKTQTYMGHGGKRAACVPPHGHT